MDMPGYLHYIRI
jgi:DNA invertase Pin-like site-specific DNA recombinase